MPGLVIGLGEKPEEDEGEFDRGSALEDASRDMMDAIKADNPAKFAAALQDFLAIGPADVDEVME